MIETVDQGSFGRFFVGAFVVLAAIVILDVLGFIQVWRPRGFDVVARLSWSIVIAAVPFLGALVGLIFWSVRATGRRHLE